MGRSIMASIQCVIKPLVAATQVISPVCLQLGSDSRGQNVHAEEMSSAFSLPPLYAALKPLSFFWNDFSRVTKMVYLLPGDGTAGLLQTSQKAEILFFWISSASLTSPTCQLGKSKLLRH